MRWSRYEILRSCLMTVYTLLFIACFVSIAMSLYYLSALALDSFQTSGVFAGILISSFFLLVSSVWGCSRTKAVQSHSQTVSRVSFTVMFLGLLACFVAWCVSTRQSYDLITETVSQPLDYWATHLGKESKLLYNFAVEFEEMWSAGQCEGNECVYSDCSGDPVVITTPLTCADEGMLAQFNFFITSYKGTADELRDCISIVNDIKNKTDNPSVPTVTWCQSREMFITSARSVNASMFALTLFQSACILISICLMYYYMYIARTEFPDMNPKRHLWRFRPNLSDSRWLQSLRSEDELREVSKRRKDASDDGSDDEIATIA
jgi:hypothetical protein